MTNYLIHLICRGANRRSGDRREAGLRYVTIEKYSKENRTPINNLYNNNINNRYTQSQC